MSAVLASTALTAYLLDVGSMVTPVYFGWLLDGGRPSMVFYTVVVTAILTIATVLNLPGNRETAKA